MMTKGRFGDKGERWRDGNGRVERATRTHLSSFILG